MINIKSKNEIELMKAAGKIVAGALETAKENIIAGISTFSLDRIVEKYIIKNGASASFRGQKGFRGAIDFPACCCMSVNDEIIHGIPGDRVLKDGDIVSIDVGACYKGFHGDAARTFKVGRVSDEAERLIKVTEESFFKGIEKAVPGNRINDISGAIQDCVEMNGFSVIKDFTGHGIGTELHEDPAVPNYRTRFRGVRIQQGMALAIEPMVNYGGEEIVLLDNKWTVVTADGSLSAHYENTVIVTNNGAEILTML